MKIMKALLVVLPVASVVFATGCSSDSVKPVPTCKDGIRNQDETDKDCGGLTCPACRMNSGCTENSDCLVGICEGGACLGGDAPLNAAQLCALYYATYQNTRDSNGSVYADGYLGAVCTQAPIFDARRFDTQQLAYLCRPGTPGYKWGQALVTAVTEGRVAVDWALAKTCLEGSRELRSSKPGVEVVASPEWLTLKLGVCKTFYEGAKTAGTACKEDWDCMGDLGCYTLTPTVAGSRTCMAGGADGDDCTEWRPCAPGLICSEDGECVTSGADGADCYYPSDCDSNVCGPDGTCITPTKGLGEDCEEYEPESAFSFECNIPLCGSCRPAANGARTTCQLYGKEGDYCRTWMDCAMDLGCKNNVCTTAPVGDLCGPGVEGICVTGAVCIPPASCDTYDNGTDCAADTFCVWDDYYETCYADTGTCIAEDALPETGACYGPGVCASRAFCNNDNLCVLLGTEGAACDDMSPCNENLGYVCADGRCTFACEMIEDCPTGQYCDTSGDFNVCATMNESACDPDQTSCPTDKYCDYLGMWCMGHSTAATCEADTECDFTAGTCITYDGTCGARKDRTACNNDTLNKCSWTGSGLCGNPECKVTAGDVTTMTAACTAQVGCTWKTGGTTAAACMPMCWLYDGNQSTCATHSANCSWDAESEYCLTKCESATSTSGTDCSPYAASDGCRWNYETCKTTEDCAQFAGQDAVCDGNNNCQVDEPSTCDPTTSVSTGVCTTKLAVGEDTIPDMGMSENDTSALCQSGYSTYVSGDFFTCSEPPSASGCVANETIKMFISMNFLFGGVLFLSRLRRRRI